MFYRKGQEVGSVYYIPKHDAIILAQSEDIASGRVSLEGNAVIETRFERVPLSFFSFSKTEKQAVYLGEF